VILLQLHVESILAAILIRSIFSCTNLLLTLETVLVCPIVSEMTYNVSMGTLNPTIPYHTIPRLSKGVNYDIALKFWPCMNWLIHLSILLHVLHLGHVERVFLVCGTLSCCTPKLHDKSQMRAA